MSTLGESEGGEGVFEHLKWPPIQKLLGDDCHGLQMKQAVQIERPVGLMEGTETRSRTQKTKK
jgi:hypothetical protein